MEQVTKAIKVRIRDPHLEVLSKKKKYDIPILKGPPDTKSVEASLPKRCSPLDLQVKIGPWGRSPGLKGSPAIAVSRGASSDIAR